MVIIAIVFTVVPKIIFVSNKTLELTVKEDGMYEAISLLGSISRLPWDENTVLSNGKILHTDDNDCNDDSGYRVGGFIGSRNCIDSEYNASSLPLGLEGNYYNDIDDYNGKDDYNESSSSGKDYNLSTTVTYDANNDNIKKVVVTVKGGAKTGNFQTSVFYESANLGYIQINKRAW
jgi:hypothetical protein